MNEQTATVLTKIELPNYLPILERIAMALEGIEAEAGQQTALMEKLIGDAGAGEEEAAALELNAGDVDLARAARLAACQGNLLVACEEALDYLMSTADMLRAGRVVNLLVREIASAKGEEIHADHEQS